MIKVLDMIKDKITLQLKNRFIAEIEKTKKDGKEHGFLICKIGDKLFPGKSIIGNEYSIKIEDNCPFITEGKFHTHPLLFSGRKALEKIGYENVEDIDILKLMKRGIETLLDPKIYSIYSPSYKDLLSAILSKHLGITNGTICTATDFGENIMECWTSRDISIREFMRATNEFEREKNRKEIEGDVPKRWIIPFFNREIIDLSHNYQL